MCLQPKHASSGGCINAALVPPDGFIPAAMHLTVMSPAQRNSKFIADLTAKRRGLRKAQVVGIGRTTTAHQTRCLATDLTCSRSRMRRGVGRLSRVLSTAVRRCFLPRCCPRGRFADGPAAASLAHLFNRTWKALSTRSASAASKVFFAASA